MRLLLDTHILLWALRRPQRLDLETRALLNDDESEILFSAASIWEIAIKSGLRRPNFNVDALQTADAALQVGFSELPVVAATAVRVADLPRYHRDPFDRLLVAQAIAEPARFVTADRALAAYSELVTVIQPMPR